MLAPGALLVLNDTRVLPARLLGAKRGSGGRVGLLLVRRIEGIPDCWRAMHRSSKPLRIGSEIDFGHEGEAALMAAVVDAKDEATGLVEVTLVSPRGSVERALEEIGHVPLPPYVKRADEPSDRERYQTVFARVPGAA